MAPRSRRTRRHPGSGQAFSYVMAISLGLVAIAILGAFWWLYYTSKAPPKLTADSLCPVEGPHGSTIVLVDASNALTEESQILLRRRIEMLANELPDYGLFEIRLLSLGERGGQKVFSRCRPKSGDNASSLNENRGLLQKRYKADFADPLISSLELLSRKEELSESPLMATVQHIAVERFDGATDRNLRLAIVSDLMEHTAEYSQYRSGANYEAFRASPVYQSTHTDLNGARVNIYYVLRKQQIPSGTHMAFWTKWIEDNNGIFDGAEKLQGLN